MANKKTTGSTEEPTRSELEILHVLWKSGPSTARFVNDYLNENIRPVIYMSTLKLMQIMVVKGLLTKDEIPQKHIYSAAHKEGDTKGILLNKIVDRIFNGSKSELVMQLLGGKELSAEEKKTFNELIKKLEQE